MPCEKYKPALIEAAITGAQPAPAIREHVEACAHCAAELAQQRSLVAAIDANLHRQMNAPVPAAMLHRLEAHLAQQPRPKRTPRLTQIFAGSLATLAVAALILMFLSHWKTETLEPNAKPNVASVHNPSAGQIQVHIGPPSQSTTALTVPKRTRVGTTLASTPVPSHHEPEVLVPPDERIALEHFIAGLHGRGEIALALAKRVPEQREQNVTPVETPDIQISSLTVPAIRESETRSDK